MGLLKITDDLHEAKRCYLENTGKGVRCVIRRDYHHKTWLVEIYDEQNRRRLDGIVDDLVEASNSILKIKKEISRKMKLIKSSKSVIGDADEKNKSKSRIGRANSLDVLGFSPGNAPRVRSRIRPFCGTDEEIRKLRRGF